MPQNLCRSTAYNTEFRRISISAHKFCRSDGRKIYIQMQEASAATLLFASIFQDSHTIQAKVQMSLHIRSHRKKTISILYET